jgi:hypothetical protein
VRHINFFGESGGLDAVLLILESNETSEQLYGFNLCVIVILVKLISISAMIYHNSVTSEYAPKLFEASKKRLFTAPGRALRDVFREHKVAYIKAVDTLRKSIVTRAEQEQQNEILKLEMSLLWLNSSYMERRLKGIAT